MLPVIGSDGAASSASEVVELPKIVLGVDRPRRFYASYSMVMDVGKGQSLRIHRFRKIAFAELLKRDFCVTLQSDVSTDLEIVGVEREMSRFATTFFADRDVQKVGFT